MNYIYDSGGGGYFKKFCSPKIIAARGCNAPLIFKKVFIQNNPGECDLRRAL
jgi:hypothetical protein